MNLLTASLPPVLQQAVAATLADWREKNNARRLWHRDATLWTGADESRWLGWLDIVAAEREAIDRLTRIGADAKDARFTHAVLLGMGGSSLGAEVFARTFGPVSGYPELLVLDSTDPQEIRAIETAIDFKRTLFIVSSKSGTTLEPNILKDYFFGRAKTILGKGKSGAHFIAITDPGSKLEAAAQAEGFRHICFGRADIGGRYSVLSDFGLVPAAIMGVDVARLLTATAEIVKACGADVPPEQNPGVMLGAIMGTLARLGRDKIMIVASPGIADIGAWLEQLIAESTGKHGKGIIPVDGEPLASPDFYGRDRLFAYLRLDDGFDASQDAAIAQLESAGQPVVRIAMADRYCIGQEFFRWELATAVAGAILAINPFDQPDVEASKVKTRELTDAYERHGALPAETPVLEDSGIKLFADGNNAEILKRSGATGLAAALRSHFARIGDGDYAALLAYVARNEQHTLLLQDMRLMIRDRKRIATCVGFGPRFLHSTGQAYKGGPDSGVFLQITADAEPDLPVPGRKFTFGAVIAAQARGDFAVLNERKRRAWRVHLGSEVESGLARLLAAVRDALA